MRRIKSYNESRKSKSENIQQNQEKISNLKKSWQEFEDQHPWEFEYFYEKLEKYVSDWSNKYRPSNSDIDCEIELESTESKGNLNYIRGIEKDSDWRKRNGRIYVRVRTGGYSGGSCWDDDNSYARPYETGDSVTSDDLISFIEHILYALFGRNHAFADIPVLLEELKKLSWQDGIKEDNETEYEYYGNYDNYQVYYIGLWNFYQFLAKQRAF